LPVTWGQAGSPTGKAFDEGPLGAGFISFPDGAFHSDPTAHVSTPFGNVGFWYDRPASRWIPGPGRLVSLDGSTYIYYTLRKGTEIHAVTVRTGADTVLAPDQEQLWYPVGLDNEFVYAMLGSSSPVTDLWRIPLDGGRANQVTTGGHWIAITAGSAWGTESAPGMPIVLTRLDLATGQTTRWGSFDDNAQFLGFDAVGWPIISIGDVAGVVVAKPSPWVDQPVATRFALAPRSANNDYAPSGAIGDSHGIWLAGADGIYLSVDGAATKISNIHAFPAGTCG
jgi:hypothetical protein